VEACLAADVDVVMVIKDPRVVLAISLGLGVG
jgi:hypothetical protein